MLTCKRLHAKLSHDLATDVLSANLNGLGIACPGYRKPLKWSSTLMALGDDSPSPEMPRSPTVWGSMGSLSGQSQPTDQSPKDLCDLDFFNSFAEVDTPGSLDVQDIGGIQHLFSASDIASEKIYPTPS
ncbi:arginine metabolism regulation protein ii [Colletotrichum asianum]